MKKAILFLVTIFSLTLMACKETKTVIVKSNLANCEGVGNQKCMQYKEKGSDNWQLFYGEIEGFTYEEGYTYELEVDIEKADNPPADASSLKYSLKKLISKNKDIAMIDAKNVNHSPNPINLELEKTYIQKEGFPLVEYDSHTRGYYFNITVYSGNYITITKNRNVRPVRKAISVEDIDELRELIKKINLKRISALESPTNKRRFDGAPFTFVNIYEGKEKFTSSTFDGGYPPAELEKIVNKILSLADKK